MNSRGKFLWTTTLIIIAKINTMTIDIPETVTGLDPVTTSHTARMLQSLDAYPESGSSFGTRGSQVQIPAAPAKQNQVISRVWRQRNTQPPQIGAVFSAFRRQIARAEHPNLPADFFRRQTFWKYFFQSARAEYRNFRADFFWHSTN